MTKRRFIDQVRQYAALAKRNRKDYAAQVDNARSLYMSFVEASGAAAAEIKREDSWSQDFVAREYVGAI